MKTIFKFIRAMASPGAKEQFLRQMEQIVEGIKQSRMKVDSPSSHLTSVCNGS